MPYTIRTPETAGELATLFRARSSVFFGEDILHHSTNPSLSDKVDLHTSTINLIAVNDDGVMTGGVRLALPSTGYVPANSNFFDFRPYLPTVDTAASTGSMLWVDPKYRTSRLGMRLVNMICRISELDDVSHLCAATRPRAAPFLGRLGFEQVAETFTHPVEKVPVVPMIRPLNNHDSDAVDLRDETVEAERLLTGHYDRTSPKLPIG